MGYNTRKNSRERKIMILRTLRQLFKWLAIICWVLVAAIVAWALIKHQLWLWAPIIAYNRPQNILGWLVIIAFVSSAASPLCGLIAGDKRK